MPKQLQEHKILPISTRQKSLGRCIFISDKWKLPSLVRQDKSQNKLMSNPAETGHKRPADVWQPEAMSLDIWLKT